MRWYEQFLSAEWRSLLVATYSVSPEVLRPYCPEGVELDLWKGKALASVVGFRFENTRFFGIPAPLFGHFAQINLRFYVRRTEGCESKRGVVFIKELCPFALVSATARCLYHENYITAPTGFGASGGTARYSFGPNAIDVTVTDEPRYPLRGSLEEFILERYHGYCKKRGGGTLEFWIEHPRWKIVRPERSRVRIDFTALYGEELGGTLAGDPSSVLLATGSAVSVSRPRTLPSFTPREDLPSPSSEAPTSR